MFKASRTSEFSIAFSLLIIFCLLFAAVQAQAQMNSPNPMGQGRGHGPGLRGPGPFGNDDSVTPPGLQMGQPTVAGSGCSNDSIGVSLTPDAKSLSILFDNDISQAGQPFGVAQATQDCQIEIPIHVPAGYRMGVTVVDVAGFNQIPTGGRNLLNTQFLIDTDGAISDVPSGRVGRSRTFQGPLSSAFDEMSFVQEDEPGLSRCGGDMSLVINTHTEAHSNPQMEQTMISLDSIDVATSKTKFFLRWRPCVDPNHPGNPNHQGNPNQPQWPLPRPVPFPLPPVGPKQGRPPGLGQPPAPNQQPQGPPMGPPGRGGFGGRQ